MKIHGPGIDAMTLWLWRNSFSKIYVSGRQGGEAPDATLDGKGLRVW